MDHGMRRTAGRLAAGAMALVAAAMIGGAAVPAAAAEKAERIVEGWPAPSRLVARAMIEAHGQPHRSDADKLTWFGLYRGRRTVVHRTRSRDAVVEQVVVYQVPPEKAGAVALFDNRLRIDRDASELSARTESVRSSLLVLNLAHEVASGFRDTADAQAFRERQTRLGNAGKSSRYREDLIFEQPIPVLLPRDGTAPAR